MLSEATLDLLDRVAERALRAAGVVGVLPTPLAALRPIARVRAVAPMPALPASVRVSDRSLLGALWFEERTMFLDEGQSAGRLRFTEAHELMHALCPWHEAVLREDTADELFRPARDALEAEANAGAGRLIFQRRDFDEQTRGAPVSLRTPLALAERYGASAHATVHHYVQTHPGPVALLVAGRFPQRDGSLPVWSRVASPSFRAGDALAGDALPRGGALRELVDAARTASEPPRAVVGAFAAEAHYNRHTNLVLLAPTAGTGRTPRGRRTGAVRCSAVAA